LYKSDQASIKTERTQARPFNTQEKYESPLKILARIIFQSVMVASVLTVSGCMYAPNIQDISKRWTFPFHTSYLLLGFLKASRPL